MSVTILPVELANRRERHNCRHRGHVTPLYSNSDSNPRSPPTECTKYFYTSPALDSKTVPKNVETLTIFFCFSAQCLSDHVDSFLDEHPRTKIILLQRCLEVLQQIHLPTGLKSLQIEQEY